MHPWLQAMQPVTLTPEPRRTPPLHAALVSCNMEESPRLGVPRQCSSSLPIAMANVEWIVGRGYQLLWELTCPSPPSPAAVWGPGSLCLWCGLDSFPMVTASKKTCVSPFCFW